MWQARFSPAHDCLLLSASSDALVNLWFLPALGGAPAAAPAAPPSGEGSRHRPKQDTAICTAARRCSSDKPWMP